MTIVQSADTFVVSLSPMSYPSCRLLPLLIAAFFAAASSLRGADDTDVWRDENLVAWSIVAFDAKKRGPEERAAMLERIGLRHYGYGFRRTDVPYFDAEVIALQRHGINLLAWLFPRTLDATALKALQVIERHGVHPQIWVTGGDALTQSSEEQAERLKSELERIRPIVVAAALVKCKVGLYNHGGWFGEPENQLAMLRQLQCEGFDNVGLVYNFHHGHSHIDRFPEIWRKIYPHVLALSINGMVRNGDTKGKKIMYVGEGDQELAMMRTVQTSGWQGPVCVLGHRTDEDAEIALSRNVAGLKKLAPQIRATASPR
jgi:hypothetical protein